jgi:uncharacterized protein
MRPTLTDPFWERGSIEQLEARLRENSWLWGMLQRYDKIGLPDAWIVAGCIAQSVWNSAYGRTEVCGIKDVDLVYFDPSDLSDEAEAAHERRLRLYFGDLPAKLDVKNEARVHLWYERAFGYPIPAYRSAADAIASFPTTATAIGVRWVEGKLECCAPFGLDDLLALRVRPNKRQVTPAIYAAKVNRWRSVWPQLIFLDWDDCDSGSAGLAGTE